jgi:hypothetical protein
VPANQRCRLHTLLRRFTLPFLSACRVNFVCLSLSLALAVLAHLERPLSPPLSLLSPGHKATQRRRSRLLLAWPAAESSSRDWPLALSRRFSSEERVTALRSKVPPPPSICHHTPAISCFGTFAVASCPLSLSCTSLCVSVCVSVDVCLCCCCRRLPVQRTLNVEGTLGGH